ncbi:hypothetical protein CSUI_005696 [Cystoisospora suis]|uniref:Uncharacterized protein n=1 Tax=Cystoisospora suis TaxID=483139 RepID=A0A2C6KW65_9APIC|nr:hypothetical protein CSUI_005696 [Cystoisospora suis]
MEDRSPSIPEEEEDEDVETSSPQASTSLPESPGRGGLARRFLTRKDVPSQGKLQVDADATWRRNMLVTFQLARVGVRSGKRMEDPLLCWIAECVYSYKPPGDKKKPILVREFFGTLPFDTDLQPPSTTGIYNDEEKTITYLDFHENERIVRCIFPLKQWKYKIFLATEKAPKLPYEVGAFGKLMKKLQ